MRYRGTMMGQINSTAVLVTNINALMRAKNWTKTELAKKSGISPRMLSYILTQERKPTVELTEALARAFGLVGWQLLLPNLPIELAANGSLERLIDNYSHASASGRDYINRVAEHEAKYKTEK